MGQLQKDVTHTEGEEQTKRNRRILEAIMTELKKINDRHQTTDPAIWEITKQSYSKWKIKDREKGLKETGGKIFLPMEEQG